ncbi:MAG TPA: DUF222 domain-containing protein [Mycobacteriales bacterium]|nr:DUF222 domain-containing protein [Mycobacteriales bacterium]
MLRDDVLAIGCQIRRLEGARAARLPEMEVRGSDVDDAAGTVAAWLPARSTVGRHEAQAVRALGRAAERLPVMGAALAAGEISPAHLQVLAAATRRLDQQRVAADEKMLIDPARGSTPAPSGSAWRAGSPSRSQTGTSATPSASTTAAGPPRRTSSGWSASTGCSTRTALGLLLALDALARKAGASDDRSQGQCNAVAVADSPGSRWAPTSSRSPAAAGPPSPCWSPKKPCAAGPTTPSAADFPRVVGAPARTEAIAPARPANPVVVDAVTATSDAERLAVHLQRVEQTSVVGISPDVEPRNDVVTSVFIREVVRPHSARRAVVAPAGVGETERGS